MNAGGRDGLFWTILAAPDEEGTLHKRLLPLATRLRGKTGTIAGVNALSGIVAESSARFFAPQMELVGLPILAAWARRLHRVCVRRPEELSPAARLLFDRLLAEARPEI